MHSMYRSSDVSLKNGHIKVINPIVRKLKSLQWVPIMICATQHNPTKRNHYIIASPVRAREHQIHAPKMCILGGLSRGAYSVNVTVYPYKGYTRSTNLIVRHVVSLT